MSAIVEPAVLMSTMVRMRAAQFRLKAMDRTPLAGRIRVRARAVSRTDDQMGSAGWRPGDAVRLLILRDFANRNQLTVKTYHAFSEASVQVLLDPGRELLSGPEVGPFSLGLAFALAASAAWEKQSATISLLGTRPPRLVADRKARLPELAAGLARTQPERADPATLPLRIRDALGRRRVNRNVFLITHPGHPLVRLEQMLRELTVSQSFASVFLPVAESEFDDSCVVRDVATSRVVTLGRPAAAVLTDHLNSAVQLGRTAGIPIHPLVVREPMADLETLAPSLARLT